MFTHINLYEACIRTNIKLVDTNAKTQIGRKRIIVLAISEKAMRNSLAVGMTFMYTDT